MFIVYSKLTEKCVNDLILSYSAITLGGESGKTAVIDIKAKGVLGVAEATDNTVATTTFDILEGGELKFSAAGGKVGAAGDGVNLSGGKITVEAAATDAEMDSSLKVTAGTVTLADAAGLTVNKGLTVSGGKVVVGSAAAATLTVQGDASFNSAKAIKIANTAGKLAIKDGAATFAAGSIEANAGTIEISTSANKTASLTFDAADYATVFAGKVGVAAADATGKLALNIVGEDEIELSTIVSGDAGTLKDTIEKSGLNGSSFTISANNVKFTEGAKLAVGAADLNFGSLAAGKSGALSIDAGNVTVNDALTVTASGDTSDLSVTATGSLTLDAKGQSGSITAKTITVNASTKTEKALNIKGTWDTAANITVTKGVVSLNDATLNLTGKLAAADSTNGTVVADNSTINTVGKGEFALSGNTLTLQNNARLELDKLDLLKDGGSGKLVLDGDKFAQDSVIGGGNTTIALMDGKQQGIHDCC